MTFYVYLSILFENHRFAYWNYTSVVLHLQWVSILIVRTVQFFYSFCQTFCLFFLRFFCVVKARRWFWGIFCQIPWGKSPYPSQMIFKTSKKYRNKFSWVIVQPKTLNVSIFFPKKHGYYSALTLKVAISFSAKELLSASYII